MTHATTDDSREVWRIGDLTLDVGQQRLRRDGTELLLPKLSFDLLLALARRAPDVVTYDELMDRVWPGLVVSPETIVQRVRLLRTAIGDDASEPRYVEALRSRGYRLVATAARVAASPIAAVLPVATVPPVAILAPVTEATSAPAMPAGLAPAVAPTPPVPDEPTSIPPPPRTFPRARLAAGLAFALLLLAIVFVQKRPTDPAAASAVATPAAAAPDATAQLESAARASRTVAVLPFENLSADPADAFIALAVPESTLDRLAALRGLTVIARDSAFRVGREARSARETGERLGAAWLVQGSVQRVESRVRVAARLIDATSDAQVWSEQYERPLTELPALQDEIAARVADALATRLSGLQRVGQGRDYSANVEANLAFLRGRALLERFTVAEAEAAAAQFEEAIARDPRFAAALAALFDARMQAATLRRAGTGEARRRFEPMIARALELDPRCGAAYLARARWSEAPPAVREADFRRGLELEPSNSRGISGYADFLQREGRRAESARWLERELLVDPLSAEAHFRRAMQTLDPDGAGVERAMLGVLERDPTFYPALQRYAKYRWQFSGDLAQPIEIIERAIASDPENPWGRHTAATFYLDVEDPRAARDVAAATPVSAASTRTLLALYEARDADAAREAFEPGAQMFNVLESWGVPEALRDAALRAGAPAGSAAERRLVQRFDGKIAIGLDNYRPRILRAQLRLARGEREAARAELQALLAWMDANERFGLQHRPRAEARMLLGETGPALQELAAAFTQDHDYRQWWYLLDHDPTWAPVRDDPRFKAIGDAVRAHVRGERAALETLRREGRVPARGAAGSREAASQLTARP